MFNIRKSVLALLLLSLALVAPVGSTDLRMTPPFVGGPGGCRVVVLSGVMVLAEGGFRVTPGGNFDVINARHHAHKVGTTDYRLGRNVYLGPAACSCEIWTSGGGTGSWDSVCDGGLYDLLSSTERTYDCFDAESTSCAIGNDGFTVTNVAAVPQNPDHVDVTFNVAFTAAGAPLGGLNHPHLFIRFARPGHDPIDLEWGGTLPLSPVTQTVRLATMDPTDTYFGPWYVEVSIWDEEAPSCGSPDYVSVGETENYVLPVFYTMGMPVGISAVPARPGNFCRY